MDATTRLAALSPRQRQMVELLVEGKSRREMANSLGIHVTTVADHVQDSLRKLGLHRRTDLVILAIRHGWLPRARDAGPTEVARLASLTPRESEVLHLLSAGESTDQIGRRLGIERVTARNHVQAILRKLRVHNLRAAVAVAVRTGRAGGAAAKGSGTIADAQPRPASAQAASGESGSQESPNGREGAAAPASPVRFEENVRRVLVVEDEPDIASLLKFTLHGAGWSVRAVGSGEQALAEVGREVPDMIVLDVLLPGINGFEVCRRVRASPVTASVPVVLLTVLGTQEDVQRGLDAGSTAHLVKPFDPVHLRGVLAAVTGNAPR